MVDFFSRGYSRVCVFCVCVAGGGGGEGGGLGPSTPFSSLGSGD